MEKKRRNSILSTFPKDEDQTTEFGMRLKRRVSFSEKKSIRVFSGEDVPKTWDNSYELSDRNDSNQNSQNKNEGTSNESHSQSSSALCTTTEFINKSNQSEIHVDHSLSLTLCAHELQSITKNWENPKISNSNEINSNVQSHEKNSINAKTSTNISEPEIVQTTTSRPGNFVYINENSNKENIAPETYELFDIISTKKSSPEKSEGEKQKMDTLDDGINVKTKSSKDITHQTHTNTPSNQMKYISTHEMDITEIAENVSGICPIPESTPSSNNESPLDFFSPLIPPGILPKCNKKLDFLQLNEDMANGRLKLFPSIQKASSNGHQVGRLISTPFFGPKTPSFNLDITDKQISNCYSEKKGKTIKPSSDIEPVPMNVSKGAIPKVQNTVKERTTYIQTLIETTIYIDEDLQHRSLKNGQTVYFGGCIENEKDTTSHPQTPSINMHETRSCSLMNKGRKADELHSQNNTGKFHQEVSSMELSESPLKTDNYEIPNDATINTNNNRRTIYLENESIEIEAEDPNPCSNNKEISTSNPPATLKKLEFLQAFPDSKKVNKSGNRHTHLFGHDGKLDFTNSSNPEQSFQQKEFRRMRRDTHYFNGSGIMDITNNSSEVVRDFENMDECTLVEDNECVIPETAPMDSMVETMTTQKKMSTQYFGENKQLNEDVGYSIQRLAELKNCEKKPINLVEYFDRNDEPLEANDCVVPETQPLVPTLQTSKIPRAIKTNQNRNLTNYFHLNDDPVEEENNYLFPESQPTKLSLQTTKVPKASMRNEIQSHTQYFNESFNLQDGNESFIPESEPMESSIQLPIVLKGSMSNQKQRLTQYFNDNEEMNLTCDTKELQNYTLSNPESLIKTQYFTNAELANTSNELPMEGCLDEKEKNQQLNPASKCLFAIKCSRLGIENGCIGDQPHNYNHQPTKLYETRKTTYFDSDESLNMTDLCDKQNHTSPENSVTTKPSHSKACPPPMISGSKIEKRDSKIYPLGINDGISKQSGSRYTHVFNNNDSMNISNIACDQSAPNEAVKTKPSKRYTLHFNSSDAQIEPIQDTTAETLQTEPDPKHSSKKNYRRTCHFEDDGQMDVTNTSPIEQQDGLLHGKTISTLSNKKKNQNSSSVKRQEQCVQLPFETKPLIQQKTVIFSSTVDEIEIETTPTSPLKTGYRFDAFSPATPHRSILEFLRMEREAEEEEFNGADNTMTNEPIHEMKENLFSNQKRTTLNLTPNLPESKKQRNDTNPRTPNSILKERQMKAIGVEFEKSKLKGTHFMEGVVPLAETTEDVLNEDQTIGDESRNEIYMENTLVNEEIEKPSQEPITPLHKEMRVSRIPIYSGSAKKRSIPRRSSVNMNSFLNLDFSLHTVEMARFAVNEAESSRYVLRDGLTAEFNLSKKDLSRKRSIFVNEDNPITISDVSEHYLSHKQRRTLPLNVTPNKPKAKNDKLMESLLEIIDGDDIEKTKLDLVETLLDESEEEDHDELNDYEEHEQNKLDDINQTLQKEDPEQVTTQPPSDSIKPETEILKKRSSLLCNKCKHCQNVYLNETTSTETNESFAMPLLPSFNTLRKAFLKGMEKMRKGPNLAVAHEFYERIKLQQSMDNLNMSIDKSLEEDDVYEDPFYKEYKKRSEQLNIDIAEKLMKGVSIQKPFVARLKEIIGVKDAKNWILNDELKHRQILRLRHKQMVTFCIIIQYDKKDSFGVDVVITHVSLEDSSVPKRTWTPFDFMANFQLKLELPFNLRSYCPGNSEFDVYEMLLKIDRICKDVTKMSKDLWKIVIEEDCNLIRENDQTSIKKIVRNIVHDTDGFYLSTEKTEFRIEVSNIKQLCFQDVTKPHIYLFREDIQKLPVGLEFLKTFLKNPKSFLKSASV